MPQELTLKLEPAIVNVVTLLVCLEREEGTQSFKLYCHHWQMENDGTLTLFNIHEGVMVIAHRIVNCLHAEVIDE